MNILLVKEAYTKMVENSLYSQVTYKNLNYSKPSYSSSPSEAAEEELNNPIIEDNNRFISKLNYLKLTYNYDDLIILLINNIERNYNAASIGYDYNSKILNYIFYLSQLPSNSLEFDLKYGLLFNISKKLGKSCIILNPSYLFPNQNLFKLFGILKVLISYDQLPRIIVGVGYGSILASLVCLFGLDKLEEILERDSFDFEELMGLNNNNLMTSYWYNTSNRELLYINNINFNQFLLNNLDNLTFLEIYEKFGKILNLQLDSNNSDYTPFLFNYLSSPNIVVRSVVYRACSFSSNLPDLPLLEKDSKGNLKHYNLIYEKFFNYNSSLSNEFLANKLSHLLNVNYFINCEANLLNTSYLTKNSNSTWINGVLNFCKSEIKVKLEQCSKMSILPTKINQLFQVNNFDNQHLTAIQLLNLSNLNYTITKFTHNKKFNYIKMGEELAKSNLMEINNLREIEVNVELILKGIRDDIRNSMNKLRRQTTINDIRERFRSKGRLLNSIRNYRRNQTI